MSWRPGLAAAGADAAVGLAAAATAWVGLAAAGAAVGLAAAAVAGAAGAEVAAGAGGAGAPHAASSPPTRPTEVSPTAHNSCRRLNATGRESCTMLLTSHPLR